MICMCRGIRAAMNWSICIIGRARAAVPVHGEHRHLIEHAALKIAELGVPEPMRIHNGDMVRLYPAPCAQIDVVPSGRYHLDGRVFLEAGSETVRERVRMGLAVLFLWPCHWMRLTGCAASRKSP